MNEHVNRGSVNAMAGPVDGKQKFSFIFFAVYIFVRREKKEEAMILARFSFGHQREDKYSRWLTMSFFSSFFEEENKTTKKSH